MTQAGIISGSGTVTQQGSGTTTLSAVNIYSGLTRVDAGRLDITGSVAGAAQVTAGATLGGTGSVAGAVTVAAGGHLAPGDERRHADGRLAGAQPRLAARL